MDKAEQAHLREINRVKEAIKRTKSSFLATDYSKYLSRLERELKEYRRYKYGTTKN